jgi:hypothetical protein
MDNNNNITTSLTGIVITPKIFHLIEEVFRHNKPEMKVKTGMLMLHNNDVLLH